MEKVGVPSLAIISQEFLGLGLEDAAGLGMPDLPVVTVPLPRGGVGSITPDLARAKADEILKDLLELLCASGEELSAKQAVYFERFPEANAARHAGAARRLLPPLPHTELWDDTLEDGARLSREWAQRGWTDGHPILPPTRNRVHAMLQACGRPPEQVLAVLPPKQGQATASTVAANAVMAGCRPEYMPVILAALDGLVAPEFLLEGLQKTTHNASPLLLVNGPVRKTLEISCGEPGTSWHANAAIGRAVRLLLINASDIPGRANANTHGWLAKYAYCIAENEEKTPWEPLHVERGFRAGESTVTVFQAEPPHNIDDQASTSAQGILTTIAGTMASVGSEDFINRGEPLLMLGPEHALRIANGGFSKADVRDFLFEHARVPLGMVGPEYIRIFSERMRKLYMNVPAAYRLPMADRPDDFIVTVAGGLGQHTLWVATMGAAKSVTRAISDLAAPKE